MATPDPSWERVAVCNGTEYYLVEPGLYFMQPPKGIEETLENARLQVEQSLSFAEVYGGPIQIIVDADRASRQTRESRRYYSENIHRYVARSAVVATSSLGRAIASFFVGFRKQSVPILIVGSIDEALEVLRKP